MSCLVLSPCRCKTTHRKNTRQDKMKQKTKNQDKTTPRILPPSLSQRRERDERWVSGAWVWLRGECKKLGDDFEVWGKGFCNTLTTVLTPQRNRFLLFLPCFLFLYSFPLVWRVNEQENMGSQSYRLYISPQAHFERIN